MVKPLSASPRTLRPPAVCAALEETTQRLGGHFANAAARQSAAACLQSLLSSVERKNSWQLAEAADFETPHRFEHLPRRGAWDADTLRDEQLGVVLAGPGEQDVVLAIDETGLIKQGKKIYQRLRAAGKPCKVALIVTAGRLLSTFNTLLQNPHFTPCS